LEKVNFFLALPGEKDYELFFARIPQNFFSLPSADENSWGPSTMYFYAQCDVESSLLTRMMFPGWIV
jgi:hypothetical protein